MFTSAEVSGHSDSFRHSETSGSSANYTSEHAGRIVNLSSGRHLFRYGDQANRLFEIVEGVVRSSKVLPDGRRQVLSFGFPGDVVGFGCQSSYHCDCETLTTIRARCLNVPASQSVIDSDPEARALYHFLFRSAASEVASMQEHFMLLGRKSAFEKVASFLVIMLDKVGKRTGSRTFLCLPMSRSDIADFLGLTVETISRVITKLKNSGIIDMHGLQRVEVLQPCSLKEIAEGAI